MRPVMFAEASKDWLHFATKALERMEFSHARLHINRSDRASRWAAARGRTPSKWRRSLGAHVGGQSGDSKQSMKTINFVSAIAAAAKIAQPGPRIATTTGSHSRIAALACSLASQYSTSQPAISLMLTGIPSPNLQSCRWFSFRFGFVLLYSPGARPNAPAFI